jgi:hypothetical protein
MLGRYLMPYFIVGIDIRMTNKNIDVLIYPRFCGIEN